MGLPTGPGASAPPQQDDIWMRIKDLQQQVQQLFSLASGAKATATAVSSALAAQVSPAAQTAQSTSFTLTTSYQSITGATFTTPATYTQALVYGSAFISAASNSSGGDILRLRVGIGGTTGPVDSSLIPSSIPWNTSTAFSTRLITGLSGGSSFLVDAQACLNTGPASSAIMNCTVSAMVLFLK